MTLDPDHGSTHLETVLFCLSVYCYSHFQTCHTHCYHLVGKHLLACNSQVPGHHSITNHGTILTELERKLACRKQPSPNLVASCQDRSLQVFGFRVSFITAGQDLNTTGQDIRGDQQGNYSNRQVNRWLICYGSCVY